MRILVVGAGATGGYFGGRLLAAGREVTFLVRPERRRRLAENGLVIRSGLGDVNLPAPTVTADTLDRTFDLVLLSCKAYDLEGAIEGFAPAVGPETAILPLLNGMRHLDRLDERFGASRVLGGLCQISSALDPEGRILHLNTMHSLVFGERDGVRSARIQAVAAELAGCGFHDRLSDQVLLQMWEKWVFIASAAGINCLMRATVADIVAAGASGFALALVDECAGIAAAHGFPPREAWLQKARAMLTEPGAALTASMLRDLERGAPIEADHVVADLLRRGDPQPGANPMLRVVLAHLKAYEARRAREARG
ncbi:MAG: 2-dehydropantoate 2-reductase [Holophaga sp.]|nr:2-dehydropantoate 2-reductase [Holophaga sp.]